jgi:hypothetical protein
MLQHVKRQVIATLRTLSGYTDRPKGELLLINAAK